jgi:hypothetical protein
MDPKSFAKLTSEDHLTIRKWNWRFAAVYGAVLVFLVLTVAAGPFTKTDTPSIEHGFSAATLLGRAH